MSDLTSILQVSKAIMDKTKTLPRNKYSPQTNGFANIDKDLNGVAGLNEATSYGGEELPTNFAGDFSFTESDFQNSQMPQEIVEAMRKSAKERQQYSESIIGKINPEKIKKQKPVIAEEKVTQNTQTSSSNYGGGIDYSLIKTIIDESVRKHISSLKKNVLTESKGSSLELMTQQGNTFRFVTSDGKIFEGKLTYKGNLKEK